MITKTSKCIKTINLLSCPGDALVREKDTRINYCRQKPVKPDEKLLEILKVDALLHVIDACIGVASCGVVWAIDEKKMHHYGKIRSESKVN